MLNTQISVTEAAAQGVRVASFGGNPTDRVEEIAGEGVRISDLTTCEAADAMEEDAQVTVTYPFEFVTPVGALAGLFDGGGFDGTVTLTADGVMPCQ